MTRLNLLGCDIWKGHLDVAAQTEMVEDIRQIIRHAPLFSPMTPWGKPMRVKMTSAGKYGWYSDKRGYRYEPKHPQGGDWAPIPTSIQKLWNVITGHNREPDCCLINFYGEAAKMGLHQDKDETNFDWPVMSISLGDSALFRMGGTSRKDPTESIWLESGDVAVLQGSSRLAFHGIDRVKFGSSTLLPKGGRINVTCRVVD